MASNLNLGKYFVWCMLIVIFVAFVFFTVCGIIRAVKSAKKAGASHLLSVAVVTFISVIIAAFSWIFNMGWLRVIMTFLLVPVIHGLVYIFSNLNFVKYIDKSKKLRVMNVFFVATYLLAYLFFPDFADYGPAYFFFGLIQNDALMDVAFCITNLAVAGHIVLFVLQILEARKIKKEISDNK